MQRSIRWGSALVLAMLGTTPALAQQNGRTGVGNACRALDATPSPLVFAPEGQTVLRLSRELESASAELARSRQLMGEDAMRLAGLRRRLDSVTLELRSRMDLIQRDLAARPDSLRRVMTPRLDSLIRELMPSGELIVRRLQPEIAAFTADVFSAQAARAADSSSRKVVVQGQSLASPRGHLGLAMSGAQLRTVEPTGVYTSHCEYLLVESVETRSPAERAGIASGDTVIAYNGRDLQRWAVNYPELLEPGDTVRVRIRRSGKAAEMPLVVAARPSAMTLGPVTFRDSAGRRAVTVNGRALPTTITLVPRPEANALSTFAGGEFASMDDDFFTNLGLKPGVLVLRVPPGSPAADAGLRSGDVVRRVNDVPIRDAVALRRAFVAASGEFRLGVQSRGAKERTIVLSRR